MKKTNLGKILILEMDVVENDRTVYTYTKKIGRTHWNCFNPPAKNWNEFLENAFYFADCDTIEEVTAETLNIWIWDYEHGNLLWECSPNFFKF